MEEFVKDFQERQKQKDEKIKEKKEEPIKPNIDESKEKEEEKFSSIDKKIENGEIEVLPAENNDNIHILFGSYQIASEGLDIPRLNTLIMVL